MGYFDPVRMAQMGINKPSPPGNFFTSVGYRDKDLPYFGAAMHIDGSCTIYSGIPQDPKLVEGMSYEEKYRYYINAGFDSRKKERTKLNEGKAPHALHGKPQPGPGGSCDVLAENGGVPLFSDPECTLGLGSFTAFLFVALNDQTRPGCGQTALLPGTHHVAEAFFQKQRAAGGIMGIEGPGWDRIDPNAQNGLGLNYLPQCVFDEFCNEAKYGPLERSPDGRVWPRPVQMLMEEGDACMTVFHMSHSGTRNEFGTESRKNIIFRIRAKAHNPNVVVNGVSDHPDRGQWGGFLDPKKPYDSFENFVDTSKDLSKEWFDPFERSKHLLCHPWEVWEGMQEVVREERAKEQVTSETVQVVASDEKAKAEAGAMRSRL
eukprot:gnl/TRDRNA2_/TRDRNA2_167054_c0_seq1.p1 gnl/TRDRNA2_/TRDRNA2_167054_c0~~gnl/TRDRNA2_/TRDRNA2_167054_c0_seq1.p1  ORF type:complete len:375 (-),score=59.09 gnl/TRDRNA2_/TRDRNA2_167054_c0_seq1:92-1216(-)